MRKVYVELKVRLIIRQDEGIETSTIINELEYNFKDTTGKANIINQEIQEFEITDSK